mgnify:CR=1 FL=1
MPIKIDFISNVTQFLRGTKQTEGALDDVADALDDMVRDGDKTERQLERNFREIANSAKDSSRKIGDDVSDGFKRAGEGADEFKDEANSTAREAAASFDGSAESIADAFQEVAANAFAGFGPAGALAGLAAAAGIGMAVAGFEQVSEAEQASRERAAGWAQAFIDAGSDIVGAAYTTAEVVAIATDPERYKQAQDNARNWGVDVSTAMLAMSGNATALQVAQEGLTDKSAEYEAQTSKTTEKALDLWNQVRAGTDALKEQHGEMSQGQTIARQVTASLLTIVESSSDAAVEVDELGNKLVTLPDSTEVFINAQTGQATLDVSKFKGDVDGVVDHLNGRDVVVRVRRDTSEWDNWQPGTKVGQVRVANGRQGGITWE